MNPTKIEYVDYTWNPVTGCWGPGGSRENPKWCSYCYARRIAHRFKRSFEPEFHEDRLIQPFQRKKPSRILVCSMADLFGDWVPDEWIKEILQVVRLVSRHTYLFLTKNPQRMLEWEFPPLIWAGTTVTGVGDLDRLEIIKKVNAPVRFVSFEPLLGEIPPGAVAGIDWAIIGGMTGPRAVKPKPTWIQKLMLSLACQNIPVFLKDNLAWPEKVQEYPK